MAKRLPASRWARIAAWTAAALAWGTTAIAVQATDHIVDRPPTEDPEGTAVEAVPQATTTTTTEALPTPPTTGLVVIRYTPVPPPEPEVIVRTVTVPGGSGGGGAARPTKKVRSSGS